MRDIKFKMYDTITNECELLDSLYELQKMNLSKEELSNKHFLQFTGLKDKNGKEIFEGDIVKHRPLSRPTDFIKYGFNSLSEVSDIVEFKHSGFQPFSNWVDSSYEDLEFEVICKIYETEKVGLRCDECDCKYQGVPGLIQLCDNCK